jgi:hypothetical protein
MIKSKITSQNPITTRNFLPFLGAVSGFFVLVILVFFGGLMGRVKLGCDGRKVFDKELDTVRLRIKFIPTRYWPYARYEVICPDPKTANKEHILYATIENVEESTPWGSSIISARSFSGEEVEVKIKSSDHIAIAIPYVDYVASDLVVGATSLTDSESVTMFNDGNIRYTIGGLFSSWVFARGDVIRIYFTDDKQIKSEIITPDTVELIGIEEHFFNR